MREQHGLPEGQLFPYPVEDMDGQHVAHAAGGDTHTLLFTNLDAAFVSGAWPGVLCQLSAACALPADC